jgi:putative hydrolase of the HAD superfamily
VVTGIVPDAPAQISTVLFDADGVLQFLGPLYQHFDEQYGWPQEKVNGFFEHLFHERPEFDGSLTGGGDVEAVIGVALAEWGWTHPTDRFVRDWLTLGAVPDREALALVAALRTHGVVCGLASNQEAVRARYMDEELGYRALFDHRFYSWHLGYAKPDGAFFRAALAELGVEPATVLFVDDRPDNVEAARGCGLHAEVHRRGDHLRDTLAAYALPV